MSVNPDKLPKSEEPRLSLEELVTIHGDETRRNATTLRGTVQRVAQEAIDLHKDAKRLRAVLDTALKRLAAPDPTDFLEPTEKFLAHANREREETLAGRVLSPEDEARAKARAFLMKAEAEGIDLDLVQALANGGGGGKQAE